MTEQKLPTFEEKVAELIQKAESKRIRIRGMLLENFAELFIKSNNPLEYELVEKRLDDGIVWYFQKRTDNQPS